MKLLAALLPSVFLLLRARTVAEKAENEEKEQDRSQPTVMVAILVRNKAHVLPHFLHYLEQQDYPKHRMSIW